MNTPTDDGPLVASGSSETAVMRGPFGQPPRPPRHAFDRPPSRAEAGVSHAARRVTLGVAVAAAVVLGWLASDTGLVPPAVALLLAVVLGTLAGYLLIARNVRTVMKRELRAYFTSPIAILVFVIFHVAAIVLTFQGWGAGIGFWERGYADLEPFFRLLPWLLLVFVPALSMRLWAEERQTGSIEMLLTLPIRPGEALLGKFFGAWGIVAFMLLLPTVSLAVLVLQIGQPDVGQIVASYLGAVLMGGAYLALGSFLSALTKDQIVAFVVSVVAAAAFSFLGAEVVRDWLAGLSRPEVVVQFGVERTIEGNPIGVWLAELAQRLALSSRFDSIGRGVLDLSDAVYYTMFIGFFLYLNGLALRLKR